MPETLHELLVQASEEHPDRIALLDADAVVTYADLAASARKVSCALAKAGISTGDRVGLMLPKSIDAVAAIYGILMSGAAYVPIDPNAPAERSGQIADNASIRALITDASRITNTVPTMLANCDTVKIFDAHEMTSEKTGQHEVISEDGADDPEADLPVVTGSGLAYILHTSGSTGRPKGVAISHRSSLTFVNMAADFFDITEEDRLCSQVPFHFDLSVFDLFVAAREGASLVIFPEFYAAFPRKYVAAIDEHEITVWNSVPSALSMIMNSTEPVSGSLQSIRVILFSGEAMPAKYLRRLHDYFPNADLYNGYGQTEANTSLYYKVTSVPDDEWRVPIGRPFPGYQVFLADDDGNRVEAPNLEGEIVVQSEAVADGYWNDSELTAARFRFEETSDGQQVRQFRTGDLARVQTDGNYVFCGRTDDMVKSRGYRIELGEIETAILSVPGVTEGACIAIPDDDIGNRLIAFMTMDAGSDHSDETMLRILREQLPAYMVPEEIQVVPDFPRTSTGKIDKNLLLSTLQQSSD